MIEVHCKDTITQTTQGSQGEREGKRPMKLKLKGDSDRGGETIASLILCCGTRPQ